METLQPAQFSRAVLALRQELLKELEELELELRAVRRFRQGGFGIWIVERRRAAGDPVLADVLWASGNIVTALQLALACTMARDFVRLPRTPEYVDPTPRPASKGLSM